MGESSSCIVRSLTQPISCTSTNQQDEYRLRALTSSVSFGRFTCDEDTLNWEKWSCFTQNRCLEEVQKLSKPGSVAAMKAYFEARYNTLGAAKKIASAAAPLPGKENHLPTNSPAPKAKGVSTNDLVLSSPANDLVTAPIDKEKVAIPLLASEMSSADVDSLNQPVNVQKQSIIRSMPDEKMSPTGTTDTGGVTSLSIKKASISSARSSVSSRMSKLQAPVKPTIVVTLGKEDNTAPTITKTIKNSMEKRSSPSVSLHKSIDFVSHVDESSKTSSPILERIRNSKIIKSLGKKDSLIKQAPTRASSHGVTVYITEAPQQENITSKVLLDRPFSSRRTVNRKLQSLSATAANCSESSGATGRKSPSPHVLSCGYRSQQRAAKCSESSGGTGRKSPSARVFSSFGYRSKERAAKHSESSGATGRKSPSRRVFSSSISYCSEQRAAKRSESSGATGRKSTSPSVISTFSFRSEERAAKRKEFFQKLENKINMEAEKVQLQAKSQIPPSRSCSPKLGKKPPPRQIHDTAKFQPPWRSSVKTDSPEHAAEKKKPIPTHSNSLLPRRKRHDNASPNIML